VEFLTWLFEQAKQYWGAVGFTVTWIGIAIIWWRRRGEWRRKQFMGQVNFSLNYARNGRLMMRTLLESPAAEVWLNQYGVKMVQTAAESAGVEQPFLTLRDPADQAFVNRAVLNVLSERFAESFVCEAAGLPVHTRGFIFGITYEQYPDMRTLKLRVLLIEENALTELFAPDAEGRVKADGLTLKSTTYKARLDTLKVLYRLHEQGRKSGKPVLGRVELGVRG
jgi:hypothetical protein